MAEGQRERVLYHRIHGREGDSSEQTIDAGDTTPFGIPELGDDFDNHVFITHCQDDIEFVTKMYEDLKRLGFKCSLAKKDFKGGKLIFTQIIESIERSKKVVTVLSKESMKSYWCTLELSLTLERCNRDDRVALLPVVLDLTEQELPDVLRQLECIEGEKVDYIQDLRRAIVGPDVSIQSLLPVGNVAHGLAWSYFYGYLNLVLPGVVERIEKYDKWVSDPSGRCMSRKVYILIPQSCCCLSSFHDEDHAITVDGKLEKVKRSRAGNAARDYFNTVHKITKESGETYYFVGEYCSVVQPMYDMEQEQIAELSWQEKKRQIHRFYFTLEDILNHDFAGKFRLIFYDDNAVDKKLISDIILPPVKKDIEADLEGDKLTGQQPCRDSEVHGGAGGPSDLERSAGQLSINPPPAGDTTAVAPALDDRWNYHVFLMYGEADRGYALWLRDTLQQTYGLTCATKDGDIPYGSSQFQNTAEMIKRSKRLIIILSKGTQDNEMAIFYMCIVPEKDRLLNSVSPIPLLRDGKEGIEMIAEFCKNLTYVDAREAGSMIKLVDAINAPSSSPRLPAGNVADGLAWSTFYGYLTILLPALPRRIMRCDRWRDDPSERRMSKKIYLLMPQSGHTPDSISDDDSSITLDGHLEKFEHSRSGTYKRSYTSSVWTVTDPDTQQDYYFVGEYIAAILVMHEMETGQVAGLSTDAKTRQVRRYYDVLTSIINHARAKQFRGKCRLLPYDDKPHHGEPVDIPRMMIDAIKADIAEELTEEGG